MKKIYTLNISSWIQQIPYLSQINKTSPGTFVFLAGFTMIAGFPGLLAAQPCSAPVISDVNITQPVCGATTGMILINAEGENLEYSINNGNTWSAGNGFGNLQPGNYNVQVRSNGSCPSGYLSNPVLLNPVPGPYSISSDQGMHGSVTPAGTVAVSCGNSKTYTITPGPCYDIADVVVDGVSVGAVSSYTFNNVSSEHTIYASFTAAMPVTPVIHGPVNVCSYAANGGQAIYTVDSVPHTVYYTWAVSPTMTIISGQGSRSITVGFNAGFINAANKRITVTSNSPCDYSTQGIYYLRAQLPSTPSAISGNANICNAGGTTNPVAYTIPAVAGASSYNWAAQSGTATITHPNGSGPADTTVLVSFSSGFTSSPLTVQAINECGASSFRSLMLQKNAIATPSRINGPTNVCGSLAPAGSAATYSVPPVAGADAYIWSIPAGSTITHTNGTGVNDTIVQVLFPAGFSGGAITVKASNGCGAGNARTMNVTRLMPSAPGAIDTLTSIPCPGRTCTYKIQSMPLNCQAVQWTVSQGYILSGQGTTTISVAHPTTAFNGIVTATGTNSCGASSTRILAIKMDACAVQPPPPPPPPFAAGTGTEVLYPNPSATSFNLRVDRPLASHAIIVRILDMQGFELEKRRMNAAETVQFGNALKPGRYMVEINDGTSKKTQTILKF